MNIAKPALVAIAAALALAGCQKADDAVFGQRVHAYLMAHPEVIRETAEKLQENEQAAAAKASTAAIGKFRNQLERDPRDIVINPAGKLTVVEFFDYRCGYCKLAAPEVVRLIEQNPDIRFVFKQFPIFGEVSDTAAKVALTPAAKAKGLDLYKSWMAEKALDDALLDRDLAVAGLDPAALRKAAMDPAIERQILDTRALATSLKIEGTPAFIIGDTLIPGADIPALKTAIGIAKGGGLKRTGT
jgi:protein-disulfide isomerase